MSNVLLTLSINIKHMVFVCQLRLVSSFFLFIEKEPWRSTVRSPKRLRRPAQKLIKPVHRRPPQRDPTSAILQERLLQCSGPRRPHEHTQKGPGQAQAPGEAEPVPVQHLGESHPPFHGLCTTADAQPQRLSLFAEGPRR